MRDSAHRWRLDWLALSLLLAICLCLPSEAHARKKKGKGKKRVNMPSFEEMDRNGDEQLTLDEMMASVSRLHAPIARAFYTRLDADGNGVITRSEAGDVSKGKYGSKKKEKKKGKKKSRSGKKRKK